jgi:mRNA interferase MazF
MFMGKVVLVPFPFDDLSSAKVRPAVCLTEPVGTHRHVIVAFISSRIPDDLLDTDVVIHPGQSDFAATGLRVTSTIRLHRLMTIAAAVIRRELGALPGSFRDEINGRLKTLFGLI